MAAERELLDVTDRTRRPLQNGAALAGAVVLITGGVAAGRAGDITLALVPIAAGLALIAVTAFIKQEWIVTYKGHVVRFENNPFLGEKLFIDSAAPAKGQLGIRSETRGVIASGDGAGDTIIARSEAGLLTLRCRITAQVPDAAGAVPAGVSDEQLLAEVRRRGISKG